MTTKELAAYFKKHLVPDKFYKIGGSRKNRICMEKQKNGWDVYFDDNKKRVGTLHFADEASACAGMKNEIRKMMEAFYGLTWVDSAAI